jgi:selenocysteine lyase/cysteine desulfurase
MAAAIAAWQELERNPVFYGYGEHERRLEDVRAKAAACLRCATEELVLTGSTTEGMNWVAQGLSLAPGDHVLTTDQEHPGGRACWDYVVRRHGVVLDIVPLPPSEHDPRAIVSRFAERVTSRTKAFSFSHVLSSTGLRMPVAELSALARARGCLSVVDGAQAAGGIDVDVKALGCHAYATSGHKWLLGPKGTGLLYLSAEIGKAIDPIALEGGRAAYSNSSGVCSLPSVLGLGTALGYLASIGLTRIEFHNLGLRNRLFELLKTVSKVRVVSAAPGPMISPMLAYVLPDAVPARELHVRLRERHQVEVKVVPGQWFNGHRISTHLFNTPADVDALVVALKAELASV